MRCIDTLLMDDYLNCLFGTYQCLHVLQRRLFDSAVFVDNHVQTCRYELLEALKLFGWAHRQQCRSGFESQGMQREKVRTPQAERGNVVAPAATLQGCKLSVRFPLHCT